MRRAKGRAERGEGVVHGVLALVALDLRGQLALALERGVQGGEHRVVPLAVGEDVHLLVHLPRVMELPVRRRGEGQLRAIRQRHQQQEAVLRREVLEG